MYLNIRCDGYCRIFFWELNRAERQPPCYPLHNHGTVTKRMDHVFQKKKNGSHCTVHPYCQDRAHLRFLFLNLTHQYDSFSMQTWQPHPQRSTKGGNSIMEKGHTLGFIHSLGTGTQDTYNLSHSYPWPMLDLLEWEMTKVVGTIKKPNTRLNITSQVHNQHGWHL